ncbi:hypothetical protein NW754_009327 [Fusarium falciforme]|nr:hypothetical protein NW754_009327 [Fusarium falciforme]
MCIRYYSWWINGAERTEGLDSLKMMLLFLQQVGVEIYAGTDHDDSILEYIFRTDKHQILGPVYDVLANCEPQFDLELDHKRGEGRLSFWIKASFLEVLHDRIDMMEGLWP